MKYYTRIKHPGARVHVTKGEAYIPEYPGCHPDKKHFLHSYPVEKQWDREDKQGFGNLTHHHLAGCIFHPGLVEKKVREAKIEGKRYAYENCRYKEYKVWTIPEQNKSINPHERFCRRRSTGLRWCIGKKKAEQAQTDRYHGSHVECSRCLLDPE